MVETQEKQDRKIINIKDRLDLYIVICIFVTSFIINYCISSFVFSINPLILNIYSKELNLTEIFSGYEKQVKLIYNICFSVMVLGITNDYLENIRMWLIKYIRKTTEIKQEIKGEEGYLIAKDENDECICITDKSLYQNVLITGSIGCGKTSGAIARLTYNLIKSGKGGLILDVKGNFVDSVDKMCKLSGRINDLTVVSMSSSYYFNILDENVSSLELAQRLKRVIVLLSPSNNSDTYWLDKVENVFMNIIVLLKFQNKLNFMEIHKLVTDDEYMKDTINEIKQKILNSPPSSKDSFEIANAISFVQNEYFKLDARVNSIIKSEITRLTIPLITDYDIYNQFCVKGNKKEIKFGQNKIIVLSLNIGRNMALAKIIATFLKISFQEYVLSNIKNPKDTFFIADEFQEFCNLEDAHFLSLSREAKCINIISTQSYSSLKTALKDNNVANVIIQNLVNKIWFRSDDNYTIAEIIKQLGKVNKVKENKSISESGQDSKKKIFSNKLRNKKSSITKSLNYVTVKENEYDENFFSRELKTFEALMFISIENKIQIKRGIFERWK